MDDIDVVCKEFLDNQYPELEDNVQGTFLDVGKENLASKKFSWYWKSYNKCLSYSN